MKLLTRSLLVVFGLLCAIALIEAGLRVAGLFAPFGHPEPLGSDVRFVVLCVGDSHTWGNGEGYPARLAVRLESRVAGARVVNLGVPGTNTAQLAALFPGWLDRYRADVVIVWSGVNNIWNRSETNHWSAAGIAAGGFGHRLLRRSKLLQLIRLTLDEQAWRLGVDQRIEQSKAMEALRNTNSTYVTPADAGTEPAKRIWRRELGGRDEFFNIVGEKLMTDEVERVTAMDLRSLAAASAQRDVPMLVITYPQFGDRWQAATRGIAAVAAEEGLIVISSLEAKRQVQEESQSNARLFDETLHPTARLYDEIGDLVFDALETNGLLPPP